MSEVVAFGFEPLTRDDLDRAMTCCVLECMVSGKIIASSGGGRNVISAEVFEWLQTPAAREAFRQSV